jgi:hypothetical protein
MDQNANLPRFIEDSDTGTGHEGARLKGRSAATGKLEFELRLGDTLQHATGKYAHHERLIDRKNDLYREHVEDPDTGEVIHHNEEPLSEHRGHGSAKSSRINEQADSQTR